MFRIVTKPLDQVNDGLSRHLPTTTLNENSLGCSQVFLPQTQQYFHMDRRQPHGLFQTATTASQGVRYFVSVLIPSEMLRVRRRVRHRLRVIQAPSELWRKHEPVCSVRGMRRSQVVYGL